MTWPWATTISPRSASTSTCGASDATCSEARSTTIGLTHGDGCTSTGPTATVSILRMARTWFRPRRRSPRNGASGRRRNSSTTPASENAMTMQSDHYGSPSPVLSAAGAAGALARPVRAKGPRVWLDMDQQELDDAYDQLVYAPNRDQVGKRRIANSERARAILGPPQRIAYGPSEIEGLDVYRTPRANAPVNIFVHGGAWRANKAADFAFLGLAPCRLHGHPRLGQGESAARYPQRSNAGQRDVRFASRTAVETVAVRQIHGRDGAGAERR